MEYLQPCIDLRRQDIEPEMFAIALAVRYIRGLINHGGSDMRRPDLESALHPEHLESFPARAVEITWKDALGPVMAQVAAATSVGERGMGERAKSVPRSTRAGET
jgi:hypothetical protein